MSQQLSLTPQQHAVLEALKRGPLTTRDLCNELYAQHPDGGPLWGEVGMRVQIHRIRRAGIPIRYIGPCGYVVAMESP